MICSCVFCVGEWGERYWRKDQINFWALNCSVLLFRRLATPWMYFLHLSLHAVILMDSSTESLVHVLMLFIQAVHGLPRLHAPGIVFCISSFSRQLPCFLMVWPSYANFLALTLSNSSIFTPASLRTHSFVFFAVHETSRIFFSPFSSKAWRRAFSLSVSVYLSQLFIATGQYKVKGKQLKMTRKQKCGEMSEMQRIENQENKLVSYKWYKRLADILADCCFSWLTVYACWSLCKFPWQRVVSISVLCTAWECCMI